MVFFPILTFSPSFPAKTGSGTKHLLVSVDSTNVGCNSQFNSCTCALLFSRNRHQYVSFPVFRSTSGIFSLICLDNSSSRTHRYLIRWDRLSSLARNIHFIKRFYIKITLSLSLSLSQTKQTTKCLTGCAIINTFSEDSRTHFPNVNSRNDLSLQILIYLLQGRRWEWVSERFSPLGTHYDLKQKDRKERKERVATIPSSLI